MTLICSLTRSMNTTKQAITGLFRPERRAIPNEILSKIKPQLATPSGIFTFVGGKNIRVTEDLFEEEYPEILTIKVDPGQSLLRIDKFLMDRLGQTSRNKIQEGIRDRLILVNGEEVKANYRVRPGDVISVETPVNEAYDGIVVPENIPLDIRYEDDHLMVIYKPAGLVVHPGYGNYRGTLVNALAYHLDQQELPVMDGNDPDRPGLVHRLDKDTSGLLVIAKSKVVLQALANQFHDRKPDRRYLALVWGVPDPKEGIIDKAIMRHPRNRLLFTTVDENLSQEGRNAVTHYRVLKDLYYVSLIECRLETGRTHQIRVHMESIGHPVFNDVRYGGDRICKGTVFTRYKQFVENCFNICNRQALHAQTLSFVHPVTGRLLTFTSELPDDMGHVLEKWERYVQDRSGKDAEFQE